ncbi:MAG: glycerophosphodiester phosphodiesterase [Ilumatobacteraceae bacterium]
MSTRSAATTTSVIAHRGASRAARENTVEAFRLAVAMGSDGIELDVRRTRDGHLVVHHDARLAGGQAIVDLARHDLPAHIPDLRDALLACAGSGGRQPVVNIEIKNDAAEPDFDDTRAVAPRVVAEALSVGDRHRWLISAFDLATVDAVHAFDPEIPTAWLVAVVPGDAVAVLRERGHRALHPWVETLDRSSVDACHAEGIAVNTWTCDDPDRMRELIDWGIDGICTNVPDVALAVRDGH